MMIQKQQHNNKPNFYNYQNQKLKKKENRDVYKIKKLMNNWLNKKLNNKKMFRKIMIKMNKNLG